VSKVFVLVGEQTQDFFDRHAETGRQQQYEELQRRLTVIWILLQVDLFDIQRVAFERVVFDVRLASGLGLLVYGYTFHPFLVPVFVPIVQLLHYLRD
jgi:hypothetical protein